MPAQLTPAPLNPLGWSGNPHVLERNYSTSPPPAPPATASPAAPFAAAAQSPDRNSPSLAPPRENTPARSDSAHRTAPAPRGPRTRPAPPDPSPSRSTDPSRRPPSLPPCSYARAHADWRISHIPFDSPRRSSTREIADATRSADTSAPNTPSPCNSHDLCPLSAPKARPPGRLVPRPPDAPSAASAWTASPALA